MNDSYHLLRFAGACIFLVTSTATVGAKDPVDFVKDVQPILRSRCYECHASANEEGGLNLAIKARAFKGGESGAAIIPSDPKRSLLLRLVSGSDPMRAMPPEGKRLTDSQLETLRSWIASGAVWPEGADVVDAKRDRAERHWAFQPLRSVEPPSVSSPWPKNAIDRFVWQRLNDNDLQASRQATPRQAIRRLYFNLIGLPPTPKQIDAYLEAVASEPDNAWERQVEALLATTHYGERWARHWLDVARYADSDGQEADRDRPHAYRYRDFVIHAFNQDMSYRKFVRWQIAGDEYEPKNVNAVVATGFLTAGPTTVLPDTFLEEERLRNRYNELDDIVSTTSSAMLGLTIGCARCHDHKFDAISSREYYQLLAAFHSGDRKQGKLPDGTDGLFFRDFGSERKTSWLFERGDFNSRDQEVESGFPTILVSKEDPNWDSVDSNAGDKRVDDSQHKSTFQRRALAEWMTDDQHGAGALLARVIVNRVWQHHFGAGLVRTPSDFGVRGAEPTHPQLLEWLTNDFIAHQWKIKRLHRMILTSATWRQASLVDPAAAAHDPDNQLLWRMRPQRLEAEALRDAVLSISGTLNTKAGGPGFKPPIPAEAIVARNLKDGGYPKNAKDAPETRRRSVYMFHKRVVPYPLFQAFDRPDLLQSCARRENTIVAPQALALLNDPFVRARAYDFADRLIHERPDEAERVQRAFELALGRLPSDEETRASLRFVTAQVQSRRAESTTKTGGKKGASVTDRSATRSGWADYCQSLFGLNEFVYID